MMYPVVFVAIVFVLFPITVCNAQGDISHSEMVSAIIQQLPGLISGNFVAEFNTNIRPKLITEFTSAIDAYQNDFLNSIYDYLKPVVIVLIVLACVQVVLSIAIVILICVFGCTRKNLYIKDLTTQVVENV